jgi:hypothetical protein
VSDSEATMGFLQKLLGREPQRGKRPGTMKVCLVTRPRVPTEVQSEAVAAVLELLSEQEPKFKALIGSRRADLSYEYVVMTIVNEERPFRKAAIEAMKAWSLDAMSPKGACDGALITDGVFDSSRWNVPSAPPKIDFAVTVLVFDPD